VPRTNTMVADIVKGKRTKGKAGKGGAAAGGGGEGDELAGEGLAGDAEGGAALAEEAGLPGDVQVGAQQCIRCMCAGVLRFRGSSTNGGGWAAWRCAGWCGMLHIRVRACVFVSRSTTEA
jgi:hypothetical protein